MYGQIPSTARRMPRLADLLECARRTPPAHYAAVLGPGLLLLALAGLQPFVPIAWLTRDPMAVAADTGMARFYFGALSNLGIMVLCGGIGAGFLGAAVAWRSWADPRQVAFLAVGAVIGTMLAIDDMFMLHENPALAVIRGEYLFFAAYGLSLITYVLVFRWEILGSAFGGLMLLALGCFAGSILSDIVVGGARETSPYWLVEDGLKFLGYLAWSTFQSLVALDTGLAGTRKKS